MDTKYSDEWYTPQEFIETLGHFDTDPCSPANPLHRTADIMYTKQDDGLIQHWEGRVWLNPPYSTPLLQQFLKKMAEHRNGIALIIPKFGSRTFRELIFPYCEGLFVLEKRIRFFNSEWVQQTSPISTNILVAYGQDNVEAILRSGHKGTMLYTKRT